AIGRSATALLREGLKAKPSPEARERIEKLLADVNREIRPDVLDLPADVPVTSVDDLLDRALTTKTPTDRSVGLAFLVRQGATAEVLMPTWGKRLKAARTPRADAAWTAGWLNAGGRPLLPLLRPLEKSKDQGLANTAHQAIDQIERVKAEPVAEAE